MAESKVKIIHDVIYLDDVMRSWVNKYTPHDGEIIASEWYVDTAKERVIFLLTIETSEPDIQAER